MINADHEKALQGHYLRLSNRPCSHHEREYAAELLTDATLNNAELAPHEVTWLRFFDAAYPPETASSISDGLTTGVTLLGSVAS